jgi:hypothetical protein
MYQLFQVKVWLPRLSFAYYGAIHTFEEDISSSLEPLLQAERVGIETGDLESAMLCGLTYVGSQFETRSLGVTEQDYRTLKDQLVFYGHMGVLDITKPSMQAISNLHGQGNIDPTVLSGKYMNESDISQWTAKGSKLMVVTHAYIALLGYLFGNDSKAGEHSKLIQHHIDHTMGALEATVLVLIDGLISVRLYSTSRKRYLLRLAAERHRQLCRWSMHAPRTFLCRQFLLEAELAVVTAKHFSKLNQGSPGLVPAAHAARDASRMSDAPTIDRISVEGGATAHFSRN